MASTYYPHRNGDYVYEVIVSTDESVPLLRRYRAHPSNVEHIDHGQLAAVLVDIQDGYGPTVSEAMRALDASFDGWRQAHEPRRRASTSSPRPASPSPSRRARAIPLLGDLPARKKPLGIVVGARHHDTADTANGRPHDADPGTL